MRGSLTILGVDPYPEGFSLVVKPGRPPRKELCPEGLSWKGGGGDETDSTGGDGGALSDTPVVPGGVPGTPNGGDGGPAAVLPGGDVPGTGNVIPKPGAAKPPGNGKAKPPAVGKPPVKPGGKPKPGGNGQARPPGKPGAKPKPPMAGPVKPGVGKPLPTAVTATPALQQPGAVKPGAKPVVIDDSISLSPIGLPPVTSSTTDTPSSAVSSTAKPLVPVKKNKISKPCEGCSDPVKDEIPPLPSRRRRRR